MLVKEKAWHAMKSGTFLMSEGWNVTDVKVQIKQCM